MTSLLLSIAIGMCAAPGQQAQGTPQPAKPAPPAVQPASPTPAPAPGYSYNPEDRRDPFMSLIGRGNDPRLATARPPGVAGLLIADVTVKGVLRDRSGFVAMIVSPDNKTYIIKRGDKLFDGSVKAIAQDKVIFSQDVNDPLSLVKQREVPKAVRSADGRGASPEF